MLLHRLQQGHDCVPLTRPSGSRQCSGWGGLEMFPFLEAGFKENSAWHILGRGREPGQGLPPPSSSSRLGTNDRSLDRTLKGLLFPWGPPDRLQVAAEAPLHSCPFSRVLGCSAVHGCVPLSLPIGSLLPLSVQSSSQSGF